MAGRPAKPMYPSSPLDEAFDDVADGALSQRRAARFCGVSLTELKRLVRAGEIETFRHGRLRLVVRLSARRWLAKKLAAERAAKPRGASHGGRV